MLKPNYNIYELKKDALIPEDAEWAFYAASVNAEGVMKIYQNCSLEGTKENGICPDNILRDKQYIGKSSFYGDQNFKGAIDDMRIYNRALTDEEVLGIYISTK